MQIFKFEKKLFWINELKSWLWTSFLAFILYFIGQRFFSISHDKLMFGIIVILLIKLGDSLTQYRVAIINVDDEKKQLTFILKSIVQGEKIKRYELKQATSELNHNSGLAKYLFSPFTLKILLTPRDLFRITNRYGFSLSTLTLINSAINAKYNPVTIQ